VSKYFKMKMFYMFLIKLIVPVLPLAYMGLIWFLSSFPSDAVVNTGWTYDRTLKEGLHLIEFGILYLLLVLALLSRGKLSLRSSFQAAVFSFFYALTDELHQYFVPSRSFTVTDVIKDLIGITVAWYIVRRAYTKPYSKVKLIINHITTFFRRELPDK